MLVFCLLLEADAIIANTLPTSRRAHNISTIAEVVTCIYLTILMELREVTFSTIMRYTQLVVYEVSLHHTFDEVDACLLQHTPQ